MDTSFSAGKSVVRLDLFYRSLSLTLKCVPSKIIAPRLHCMSFSDSTIKRTDVSSLMACSQMLWHGASHMPLSRFPFPWIRRNHSLTRIHPRQLNQRATCKSVSAFTSTQKMACQFWGCYLQASVASSAHSRSSTTGEEACGTLILVGRPVSSDS